MTRSAASLAAVAGGTVDDFPVALAWAADGTAVAVGGGEGRLYLINAGSSAVTALGEHAPGVLALAWQPKGVQLASAGQDGGVRLWKVGADGWEQRALHRAKHWPAGLAWRGDGQQLAVASGREALVFDAEGHATGVIAGHDVVLSHLAWRGRDELVGAGNGALFVDRVSSGAVEKFVLEGTPVTLAISGDLKLAANGLADGTVNFRYLNNRKRSRMSGYAGKVNQCAWSANSRYLATASTGASSIAVWDFGGKGPEGSEPLQLNGHEERIESLAWQSGGPLLAAAGRDWRVSLWRPGPGSREALDIQLLDGPALLCAWSPDGRHLAVAQQSGRIRIYQVQGGR